MQSSSILFQIRHIDLLQFRNYSSVKFSFDQRITAICGSNGKGKTNLLDAIYYLCFTKSYFTKTDLQSVEMGSIGFRVSGEFKKKDELLEIALLLRENNKKELQIDGEITTLHALYKIISNSANFITY